MHKTILMCLCLLFVMAMPASGEYYQYQDDQGNLRFTDDIANVPENHQIDITAFESVKSEGVSIPGDARNEPSPRVSAAPARKENPSGSSREELEAIQANLDQTARSINARRKELEAQRPAENAADAEKKAYFEKVNALNADLQSFKQQQQEYNEKVKAFNSRISEK